MPHVCAAILQGHLYLLHHRVNNSPSLVLTKLPSAVVSTSQFELYMFIWASGTQFLASLWLIPFLRV